MSLSAQSFGYVAELVRRESAVELAGKEYLVASRLAPLARAAGLEGAHAVDRYVHLVRGRREDARRVVEAMVVTETSWFRDGAPFRALTRELVPALGLRRRPLQVWSAGCSTGQEPYSVAMTLLDAGTTDFAVLATDVSASVLARAAAARYDDLEVSRGLPDSALGRFLTRRGDAWHVRPVVRGRVTLRRHNLLEPSPPARGRFDVVFLRNVLMYFDLRTRGAVLERVRSVLAPDGFLVLGTTETPLGIDPAWVRVKIPGTSIYRLLGGPA
ncbi:protein-glutamate O-methyltransferase CheR [Georgenia yuyongxinii]|uniref:Protein-glutamate O-methyltransferase CheR n=1 Tax=Georgenia yuyongxinii TaxID=2589797 RepID=A0A5B8C321_9MICO|nr:protein-glutamate O-methyltransferase CheR [Georgenia yuyongxinii]QDC23665.1 protein-glutamate O-methyltransferase CheR [Georgenia yuyongxinii]